MLPLFSPPETIAFWELETRHQLNDPDAIDFWKSQRKFMEKIFARPASSRGTRSTATGLGTKITAAFDSTGLGTKITAAFDSLNINTRS